MSFNIFTITFSLIILIKLFHYSEPTTSTSCIEETCFYVSGERAQNLEEAQKICGKNNTKLLELNEKWLQDQFINTIKSLNNGLIETFWLNLKAEINEWRWIDGTECQNWISNVTNDPGIYGTIKYDNSTKEISFHGVTEEESALFMCSNIDCNDQSCLSFPPGTGNLYEARKVCINETKDLAVLKWLQTEQNFSNIQHYNQPMWIGLTRQTYKWQESGTLMKYSNWLPLQPAYGIDQVCAYVDGNSEYKWRSSKCSDQNFRVVCMSNSRNTKSNSNNNGNTKSSYTSSAAPDNYESAWTKIGIGVGVGLSLFLILVVAVAIGIFCFYKKKRTSVPQLSTNKFLNTQAQHSHSQSYENYEGNPQSFDGIIDSINSNNNGNNRNNDQVLSSADLKKKFEENLQSFDGQVTSTNPYGNIDSINNNNTDNNNHNNDQVFTYADLDFKDNSTFNENYAFRESETDWNTSNTIFNTDSINNNIDNDNNHNKDQVLTYADLNFEDNSTFNENYVLKESETDQSNSNC